MKRLMILIFLPALGLTLGCTRKTPQNTTVRFSLGGGSAAHQKAGSLALDSVSHVILNVSGPGISPAVFSSWERRSAAQPVPDGFEVSVPRGENRLFQALVLFDSDGASDNLIYYGDLTASVSGTTASVDITVTPSGASNAGDSRIAGRYMTTASGGPTGKVGVYFSPPSKPTARMLVDIDEIFGGWFNLIAVEGAKFEYMLADGSSLFGGPVSVEDVTLLSSSPATQNLRVLVPNHYENREDGSRHLTRRGYGVLGWFGPGASGKNICYPTAITNVPDAYQTGDLGDSETLQWNPQASSPGPADVIVEKVNGGIRGGEATATLDGEGLCTAATGTRFADYLSVDSRRLTRHDGNLGFYGPFQVHDNGNGDSTALSVSFDTGMLRLKWNYLPGVYTDGAAKRLDGADVFARVQTQAATNTDADYKEGDGVACGALAGLGFNLLLSRPVNPSGLLNEDFTVSSPPAALITALTSGSAALVVCPYRIGTDGSKQYFQSAAVYRTYGGGSVAATSMAVIGPQGENQVTVANGVCTPVTVQGRSGPNPAPFNPTGLATLTLTASVGVNVYASSDCTTVLAGNMLPVPGDRASFYILSSNSGTGSGILAVTAPSLPVLNVPVNYLDSSGPDFIKINAPASIVAQSCYEAEAVSWNSSDNVMVPVASDLTGWAWPVNAGLEIYPASSGGCAGTTDTSVTLTPSVLESKIFFRYTGAGTTISLQPSGSGYSVLGGGTIAVTQPGPMARLEMNVSPQMQVNQCQPVWLRFTDAVGNSVPVASTDTVTLGGGSGTFFQDSSCTTVNPSVTFSTGDVEKTVYYRAPATAGPVSLTAQAANGYYVSTRNVNVVPLPP